VEFSKNNHIDIQQELDGYPLVNHGIKLTGGFKSSLIVYLIAKEIHENNAKGTITPLCTVVQGMSYQRIKAEEVIRWISKQFPSVEFKTMISNTQTNNYDVELELWTNNKNDINKVNDLSKLGFFPKGNEGKPEGFQHRLIDSVWSGDSARVSKEVEASFLLDDDEYHLTHRGFEEQEVQDYRAFTPFINLNSKDILDLYKEHDIQDSLLPLTYNCSTFKDSFDEPCGRCPECQERMWANNIVNPPAPNDTLEQALRDYPIG